VKLVEFAENGDVLGTPGLDAWRAAYLAGTLALDDHRRLYEQILAEFPEQNYYSLPLLCRFMGWSGAKSVVELGGWDGAMARDAMPLFSWLKRWDNYEIVDVPQVCVEDGYHFHVPDAFMWEQPIRAHAFVASHSLEHLTWEHLVALIEALDDVEHAYVDVPLHSYEFDWQGTTTTHALTCSISQFDKEWIRQGWKVEQTYRRDVAVPSYVRFLRRY
jgi:hypothetical protein